tara:strand:+ start:70 stop:678 length:609 start_codon:yes stop_codon:yes gene_type:complete
MSSIKLKHSGGNSSIIAAPNSNPASDVTFRLPNADGTSGQALKTDGSGNLSFASVGLTSTAGTMTIRFEDNANGDNSTGVQSTTVVTGRYYQVGDMVHCSFDTGNIQKPGNIGSGLTVVTGAFPVTRDSNWTMVGIALAINIDSDVNNGSEIILPRYGYWRNNTSMYFSAPRSNSSADNVAWNMFPSNGTGRIYTQYSYKAA